MILSVARVNEMQRTRGIGSLVQLPNQMTDLAIASRLSRAIEVSNANGQSSEKRRDEALKVSETRAFEGQLRVLEVLKLTQWRFE